METTESYQIKLEIFEGPLDLLLFLIKKQKIAIHDIPVSTITQEYLEYLGKKEQINLDREAEFLFMASLLIYIKSQMLLPRERLMEEVEDPSRELFERLLDYQKIKAASSLLRKREDEELLRWKRTFLPSQDEHEEEELEELSLFALAERFFNLMKRKERENTLVIRTRDFSIEDKMKEIIDVLRKNAHLDFLEYFFGLESLEEALVSFFSLLELLKARAVEAVQDRLFDSIKVWLAKDYHSGRH